MADVNDVLGTVSASQVARCNAVLTLPGGRDVGCHRREHPASADSFHEAWAQFAKVKDWILVSWRGDIWRA